MSEIIAIRPHDEHFAQLAKEAGATIAGDGDNPTGVFVPPFTGIQHLEELLAEHNTIEWVQLPLAGVDKFLHIIRERTDIAFASAKGAYSKPVAQHGLALTLALLNDLHRRARASEWDSVQTGEMLYGKRVTILGGGGIAEEYARLIAPFGCEITAVRHAPAAVPGADRTVQTGEFASLLPTTDVLFLASALNDETRAIVNAEALRALPKSAVVVNISRGPVIDTDALVAALADQEIAGAGLDVTDPEPLPDGHPLWSEPRALITPHTADTVEQVTQLLGDRFVDNIARRHRGADLAGVVNPARGY
ncbi:D-isomer specific 2-hydroxyacid dehydrogenase family protein [uncultured Agrococcus sp.]|uniref:D-isomer specific 2-hydroxyacid dehydrogenase family protein n=1 Tax=uncultured Agrococcus sp. TaxID=382258 RepID=UPI0025E0E171|nr:D-isomer specific 2-hydroxyacid dehydrogenase family protein [uncultured Agrococcus sp.]